MNWLVIAVMILGALGAGAVFELRRYLKRRFRGPPQRHRAHSPEPGYDKAEIARSAAEGQALPGYDPGARRY